MLRRLFLVLLVGDSAQDDVRTGDFAKVEKNQS
jgi:hypothetical protein